MIMPALKPQPMAVSFALDLPEVVKDHAAYVRLDFDRHSPETDVDDKSWRWPSETLLVQPNGTIMRLDTVQAMGTRSRAGILDTVHIDSEALEFGSAIELDASLVHRLKEITVFLPVDPRTYQPSVDMFVEIKRPLLNRTTSRAGRGFVQQYFDNLPPFRAAQGKENTWRIEIPEWLVEAVQQRVEATTASRSDDSETGN